LESTAVNTDNFILVASSTSVVSTDAVDSVAASKTKTAVFQNLEAGESYVMLVVIDEKAENLLSAGNLLYIAQGEADDDGTLAFTYKPRTSDTATEKVYGASGSGNASENPTDNPTKNPDENSTEQRKDISTCTVTLSEDSYTYDGTAKKPAVTVTDNGSELKEGTDYEVFYKDNTDAGTAVVAVVGIGNYHLLKKVNFTINQKKNSISAANVTKTASSKAQSFSLSAKPKYTAGLTYHSDTKSVKVNAKGTVTIAANFVGKATITVTAKETQNYKAASKPITITVNPAQVKLTSVKSKKTKQMTVVWKKSSTASGYLIQYSTNSKLKKGVKSVTISGAKKTSTTIKKLAKGKKYYVRVQALKKVGKTTYRSQWSNVLSVKVK
jgi:hypothetical protein